MREQRIIHRPLLSMPERQCLSCGGGFRVAWGWLLLPDGDVIDLDGNCARRLRYCAQGERRELIAEIKAKIDSKQGRRAA